MTEDFDFSFEGGEVSFRLPRLEKRLLPPDFKLGLLVGPSGSGKTTLLRKFGEVKDAVFDDGCAVIENECFCKLEPTEAQALLRACLLTGDHWLRPYKTLSGNRGKR